VNDLRVRPGRPRRVEVGEAIVAATLDLFVDDGYSALTVEAVAARAGVGKSTVYRRWPNKDLLVADALASLNDELPPVPVEGPVRDRLIALLEHIRLRSPETCSGRIMPRMVAYARSHPDLYAVYQARVLEPRRERVRALLREGVVSGELRADLDVDLATTCFVAPMLYISMVMCSGAPAPDGLSEQIVDLILQGVSSRSARANGS
jgi:AcrR family transcriptional regulator